ncbi:hypothetical protein [Microbacterium indicum]|uniref:hypothetical protein n=1 Tax=Microbacterium indicum TaxID=358100 RepID=UPI0003F56A5F|nr:hypothetical protein [Microbacterium indicum]
MSDAQGPKNDATGEPEQDAETQAVPETPAEAVEPAADPVAAPEPVSEPEAAPAPAEAGEPATAEPEPATTAYPAASSAEPQQGDPVEDDEPATSEPDYEALAAELDRLESSLPPEEKPAQAAAGAAAASPWFEPAKTETFTATEPAVTPSEPTAPTVAAPAPAPSPIFVQAPEPPRRRGNRAAAGAIGLVAAVAFAAIYGAATLAWEYLVALVNGQPVTDWAAFVADPLLSAGFWFTVIAFWLAFWLLGVFVNRARWWSWVILGVLVAALTYAGHIGGVFLDAPFWNITASEGTDLLVAHVLHPLSLLAFISAREVTVWFGAWVSRRGSKVTAANAEAKAEYERVIAEGPESQI